MEPVESAYAQDAACGGQTCIVTSGAGEQSVVAVAVRGGPDGARRASR
ncbi:hypothetical protein [Pseudonocardia abyssalis]|uniref:Uncharacterized protein n=1 Tax=Pseudonocardia abyssalis TaxID=2792008 RepID=A0ABS6V0V4_9PSEU|nr:hypothetical protein [Pseudonocardia abyssalis]MBW0118993.1 hypothetical protein [Pseudonocardia abyssalis]MBW0138158.1 hypothetical protein [Pseudonocardia abyssalis]